MADAERLGVGEAQSAQMVSDLKWFPPKTVAGEQMGAPRLRKAIGLNPSTKEGALWVCINNSRSFFVEPM